MNKAHGLLLLGLLALAAGCEEQGPAEQAGERIDQAAEQARETAEDVQREGQFVDERTESDE